jgi:pectin methylesterase-like acyl-CoA thioesterase
MSNHQRIAFLFICFLFSTPLMANDVITVGQDGGTSFTTIQEAIDAAVDGDEVVVSPGTYYENIDFGGKNIILRSTDPEDPAIVEITVIDGQGSGHVVTFAGTEHETCVLSGLTITGLLNLLGLDKSL